MKSKLCICSTLLPFVMLLVFVACRKADQTDTNSDPVENEIGDTTTTLRPTSTSNLTCSNAPFYGDSIIYAQPKTSGDIFVHPVTNVGVEGTYLSWPEGLIINRTNGYINVSQSETGVRYKVAFVKKGTTDTCVSQLIVGGMTYLDGIYVLDQNDTLVKPIFNTNPAIPSICDNSDDSDYPDSNATGNNKCSFDEAAPGQKANDLKLRVRTKSGIINLKKSLADGLFGPVLRNGAFRRVPIQYRLNDGSHQAVQTITVEVMYYDKVSSIPASLQQEVASKRTSMYNYQIVSGKPRPPYLIIAGLSY
jgi:hypothetical protein